MVTGVNGRERLGKVKQIRSTKCNVKDEKRLKMKCNGREGNGAKLISVY